MMRSKRWIILLTAAGIFLSFSSPLLPHSIDYFILGITVNECPFTLKNAWALSEGRDFFLTQKITFGYEIGLSHRYENDPPEFLFKTFFNMKFPWIHFGNLGVYAGGGAGLLESIRVNRLTVSADLQFSYQVIFGLRFGRPNTENICLELHFLQPTKPGYTSRLNILTGVTF
ncbi:MAG: hypothetical protein JXB26_15380 [Candidatus Aminicenantes bacterium]|nr:hypothetical protein [Candidatus Aminicenantes bacterium]